MPPKKLKKPPKNPFFFFMMDWKKEQEEMGRLVPGALNLLAEAATPDWQSLSESDKEYYKEKAKVAKEEDKVNLHNKFTTEGKSYAQVYAEQKEMNDFQVQMKKEIVDTVNFISQNPKRLLNHKFYLIHANHYCYWTAKSVYIPCEVAIAEYSIEDGVTSTIHFFPAVLGTEQGKLPMGYLHEAQEISKRTHNIRLPPLDEAQDYDIIVGQLLSFLQQSGTSKLPPLYTLENNLNCNYSMSTVKDFLQNCEDYCEERFRTYNLDLLFYELRNACADFAVREGIDPKATGFPSQSLAQMELDRDIFHFTKGISCDFHEHPEDLGIDSEVCQYCSKSTVQRWCFLISDYCCKDVGVPLKQGRHCPLNSDVSFTQETNESRGWNIPATSEVKRKAQYVDAPPPAVNSWGRGPPKMDSKVKESPKVNSGTVTNPVETKASVSEGASRPESSSQSHWGVTENATPQTNSSPADDYPALDGCRLPKTRGRGERLLAAINRVQLDANYEDFPALGGGRGRGRF